MGEIKHAHTPGPWWFIDATQEASMQYAPKCVIKAGYKQIAAFSWGDSKWWPTKDESQANATLIAAAPDMLTALETVLAGGHLTTGEQAIVANAIAKATGQGIDEVLRGN